jgi:hypothetical protein
LQALFVRPVQPIAEVLYLVPLSFELHAKEQQREKDGEEGALHGAGRLPWAAAR